MLGKKAIKDLGVLARELKCPSGYRRRSALYIASQKGDLAFLRDEVRREKRIGISAVWLNRAKLRKMTGLDLPGAALSKESAEVNAFALTRGIFRHHRANRHLRVFTKTQVSTIRPDHDGVTVRTTQQKVVNARYLVVAAGYESGRFLKSDLVRLHSTYVIASRALSKAPVLPKSVAWETARPYFYLRTTPDNRIVFGGLDEPFANAKKRDRLLKKKQRALERRFASLFPKHAFHAEFAWTGTFAETRDGLPCIGPANLGPRILFALGYGGNGITFSQIAAELLRDYCLGKKNANARIFRFDRKIRKPLKKVS